MDLSSFSSQYGRFVSHQGFEMIQYPKLFLSSNKKLILNPSFIPELATIIHEAVSLFLYPEITNNVFSMMFEKGPEMLAMGPLWDFGRIHLFVITVVEEIKDNNQNTFMAHYAANRVTFWETHLKQLQSVLPSQKVVELHTLFVPLRKVPTLSIHLTENLELVSTNNTSNRKDMHLIVYGDQLIQSLLDERDMIFEELGIPKELAKAKESLGKPIILSGFLYLLIE